MGILVWRCLIGCSCIGICGLGLLVCNWQPLCLSLLWIPPTPAHTSPYVWLCSHPIVHQKQHLSKDLECLHTLRKYWLRHDPKAIKKLHWRLVLQVQYGHGGRAPRGGLVLVAEVAGVCPRFGLLCAVSRGQSSLQCL